MLNRRQFFKAGIGAAAFLAARRRALASPWPIQSPALRKFIAPLRGLGPGAIPVAASDGTRTWGAVTATHYTIDVREFEDQLHPDLPGPAKLWGYGQGDASNFKHLGGVFVAPRATPVQVTFRNHLPCTHVLRALDPGSVDAAGTGLPSCVSAVDTTLPGANQDQNRIATHLHGGLLPWISDGGPHDWWTPGGDHGLSFRNNEVLNPGAADNEAEYYYPNDQSGRLLWYHDHAHGITRLNAYAGIASGFLNVDPQETSILGSVLPPGDIPLVIQEKIFYRNGEIYYPTTYDPAIFELEPGKTPLPEVSCLPEFWGDTPLVNGTAYPFLPVEPRRYRFRILNATQARVFRLRVVVADATKPTEPKLPLQVAGKVVHFATEGGLQPRPVQLNVTPTSGAMVVAPGERCEVIVDFAGLQGSTLLLYNDAGAPYPGGDPVFDYQSTTPGFGPDTRTILQFRVAGSPPGETPFATWFGQFRTKLAQAFAASQPALLRESDAATVRDLTLNEAFDEYGRLAQLLGTNVPVAGGAFGRDYLGETTESIPNGSTEVWRIFNLSGDTHPIHFHLANCQILSRQPFDYVNYNGTPVWTGGSRGPEPIEYGWKETVRMNPGECTKVIFKFELPPVPFVVPPSLRTGGAEFVWHCHILEHEEHDMMRPLVIT